MNTTHQRFTKGEELANASSHFLGALFGAVALFLMLQVTLQGDSRIQTIACIIYGLSLIVLYLCSTINHILPQGRNKELFFNLDQMAIYILIAGTYTPITLIGLQGNLGWGLFWAEWIFAAVGIGIRLVKPTEFKDGVSPLFIGVYIVMGCLILFAIPEAIEAIGRTGFFWLLGGGAAYIGGTVFYRMKNVPYSHLGWHLACLLGSALHFGAIYYYILLK